MTRKPRQHNVAEQVLVMTKFLRIGLLIIGAFLSQTGHADNEGAPGIETDVSPDVSPDASESLDQLLDESVYGAWSIDQAIEPTASSADWQYPIDDLDFEEASGLARIARERSLSFLTLPSSGNTRLFFGVNEDGTVGLHYRADSEKRDAEFQELGPAPEDSEADSDEAEAIPQN